MLTQIPDDGSVSGTVSELKPRQSISSAALRVSILQGFSEIDIARDSLLVVLLLFVQADRGDC